MSHLSRALSHLPSQQHLPPITSTLSFAADAVGESHISVLSASDTLEVTKAETRARSWARLIVVDHVIKVQGLEGGTFSHHSAVLFGLH